MSDMFEHIFGYRPLTRLRCSKKELITVENSLELLGLTRWACAAKTYNGLLSKSVQKTGHCLIFGSLQDKNLFNQPKCYKNLISNSNKFLPDNPKCSLIKDFTDLRQLLIPTHNIKCTNQSLTEASFLRNSFSLNLDLIITQNNNEQITPDIILWIAKNVKRVFEPQLNTCHEFYFQKLPYNPLLPFIFRKQLANVNIFYNHLNTI